MVTDLVDVTVSCRLAHGYTITFLDLHVLFILCYFCYYYISKDIRMFMTHSTLPDQTRPYFLLSSSALPFYLLR
jgi:hypothetical protein